MIHHSSVSVNPAVKLERFTDTIIYLEGWSSRTFISEHKHPRQDVGRENPWLYDRLCHVMVTPKVTPTGPPWGQDSGNGDTIKLSAQNPQATYTIRESALGCLSLP